VNKNKIYSSGTLLYLSALCFLLTPIFLSGKSSSKNYSLNPNRVDVYLTAKNTQDRLTQKESVKFEPYEQPDESHPAIMIDVSKKFQTIEGFGGAFTDASAETFYKLPPQKQKEFIDACFDAKNGNAYTLCRMNIHSCDFSSESYTYAEVDGGKELKYFSIEHDKKYRIPFIKRSLEAANNNIKILASPWSPPAWMKTNGSMLHGGKLRLEYRQTWADYFVRFVEEYKKEDISMWGLTVQNEPMAVQTWESCIFTAKEESDFVRDYLGPTLKKAGLSDLKLLIWDHNRGIIYQRAKAAYDDPEVSKYIWGTAFHWYIGDHFDNVRLVHDAFPDKKLIYTEAAIGPFRWDDIYKWSDGEELAKNVIMDLNNWTDGWIFWNLLLDEKGGPNHVSNFCFAPIIADTRTGELIYRNTHYYFGHFSKFIHPGAKRIICSSNDDELLSTAFLNPDDKIAVVILNDSDNDKEFHLWLDGKGANSLSPAHSIITMIIN
jgi:glucosylceramidase